MSLVVSIRLATKYGTTSLQLRSDCNTGTIDFSTVSWRLANDGSRLKIDKSDDFDDDIAAIFINRHTLSLSFLLYNTV